MLPRPSCHPRAISLPATSPLWHAAPAALAPRLPPIGQPQQQLRAPRSCTQPLTHPTPPRQPPPSIVLPCWYSKPAYGKNTPISACVHPQHTSVHSVPSARHTPCVWSCVLLHTSPRMSSTVPRAVSGSRKGATQRPPCTRIASTSGSVDGRAPSGGCVTNIH